MLPRKSRSLARGSRSVPGDVFVTGTPAGVGLSRKPPLWMKAGDLCEVEIDRIGILRNPVVNEDLSAVSGGYAFTKNAEDKEERNDSDQRLYWRDPTPWRTRHSFT